MFNVTDNRRWALLASGLMAILCITALVLAFLRADPLAGIAPEESPSLGLVSLAAVLVSAAFAWWAFHDLRHAFRYGVCALAGLLHDALVTCGFYALMALVAGWEVDSLFFVALLAVVAVSAQGLVVTFDRIRENEARRIIGGYEMTVRRSVVEAVQHTLPVRLGVLLALLAVLLLGGAAFRPLAATILVGLASATYSAPFFTTALLAAWDRGARV